MGISSTKKLKADDPITERYKRFAFGLLVFFVFLVPTKFGLINLDMAPTLFPPVPNFLSIMEQFPEEIGQAILILILLLWLMGEISNKKLSFKYSLTSIFFGALILVGIISTFRSVVIHSSVIYLKSFISYFLFFHLVLNLASNAQKQRILIGSFIAGSAVVGLIGVYQYFIGLDRMILDVYRSIPQELWADYIGRIERGRVFATFTYPNSLAGFLLIAIPLSFAFAYLMRKWFHRDSLWKGILYGVIVIIPLLVSFIFTESKGGYLISAILILIAFIFAWSYFPAFYRRLIVVALIVAVTIGIALSLTPKGRELIEKGSYTFEERIEYWRAAGKMVPLRPILGSGFFSFAPMYNKYRSPEANDTQTVHNNYLQILVETGFVGLIFFIGFWVSICFFGIRFLIKSIKGIKTFEFSFILTMASFLGLLGFLLHNIVDFDLYIPGIAFSGWFVGAIILLNSEQLREFTISFKKEYAVSITLISITVVSIFAVFLTVKTLWGGERFYTGYLSWDEAEANLEKNPPYAKEMFNQAENDFESALWWDSLNHNFYAYYGDFNLRLGEIYHSADYIVRALDAYKRAISLNRFSPVYRSKLIIAMETLAVIDENYKKDKIAIQQLWREVIEYAPTASYFRIFYAEELRLAGKTEEALMEYKTALNFDPELKNALRKSVGRYNEMKLKSSIENLEKLIKEEQ